MEQPKILITDFWDYTEKRWRHYRQVWNGKCYQVDCETDSIGVPITSTK